MSSFEVIQSGVIYRNPNPGYQYVFASHSHPVQLSRNELYCTYQVGQAMYSTDLKFAASRSMDGGLSWMSEGPLFDSTRDRLPYSYHDPFLARTRRGGLVITAFRVDRSDPEAPMFNEETGGLTDLELVLLRSEDGGDAWSLPEPLELPDRALLTPTTSILELPDGEWMVSFDQWHPFHVKKPYEPRTMAYFSKDEGKSWSGGVTFADGNAYGKGFWHGKLAPRKEGGFYGLFWSAEDAGQVCLNLHRCIGSADGRHWTEPEPTNIPGQTNWPVCLGSGKVAAIYTQREGSKPGFYLTLSRDDGATFDLDAQLCLWDATGRDKLGVESADSYPRSHDSIAFGAPTLTQLEDGDLFASFWCTEMSVTQVRCARLRLTGG